MVENVEGSVNVQTGGSMGGGPGYEDVEGGEHVQTGGSLGEVGG